MIIAPFNTGFFVLMAAVVAVIVILSLSLRKASENVRRFVIIGICIADIIIFFVYKWALSGDAEFLEISGQTEFNWFSELPLHLCNINMFLIPIALLIKKRGLLSFCFFVAPLGALMAMLSPEPAFTGFSLFVPRIAGFYVTHAIVLMAGILLVSMGFYRPSFKDLPLTLLTVVLLVTAIHGLNALFRATVCPNANYFFTMETSGVSILDMFWNIIPHPYWYLYLALLILLPYLALITTCFYFGGKLAEKRKKN